VRTLGTILSDSSQCLHALSNLMIKYRSCIMPKRDNDVDTDSYKPHTRVL